MDEPFPNLAEVPPRPEARTTAEERKVLKAQLQRRREEIQKTAASLLRGGTEPVPIALNSQVPAVPDSPQSQVAPPPLPAGLPQPPERPEHLSDADKPTASQKPPAGKVDDKAGKKGVIAAPLEEQMPPARAAGESGEEPLDKDDATGDARKEADGG